MDRAILLTGATGFIGGRLCLALLRGSPATLYCLVRGRTARGARERLHAYLGGLDGLPFDADRLRVVPGNLVRPRLGLPAAEYGRLARAVTAVYHCAATVNLAASYDHLVPGNVTATENVVRFAAEGRPKTLHHVSTDFVFADARHYGLAEVTEATEPTYETCGAIGYSQTKLRGEEVVRRAAAEGLPAAIYRPGLVLGDSRTGAYADTELSVRLIRAAVAAGCAPVTAAEVPAAPVDYVAEAIAALSLSDTAAGGVPSESVGAFHPNLPEPIPVATVFDRVRACGYDLPECDPAGWRAALFRRVERPAATMALACWEAMSYLVVPEPRYLPPLERATATHDALRGLGVRPPDVDVPMMARILARLAADGLLPSPEAQGRAQFPSQRV